MEKKKNFVQVPLWLSDEFKTVKEFQAFIKMYNGWCLMKDADGWYYRSKSKLKEDFGMNPNCSDTRVTKLIKRFEELGILHIKSEGKKANWYKFDEHFMFNHEEYDTNDSDEGWEQNAPKGKEQVVPKGKEQVVPKQEGNDRNKLYLQYNTKENIHDKISRNNITCTENDKTIPPDINGYKFWDNPTWYVIELTSRPYDDTCSYLIEFMHYDELSKVREALSQLDDKSLAEQLNNEIDNCIHELKGA